MSTTIGTAPDQVPVNGMLGDMAFQSKSAVTIGTLTSNGTTSTDLPTYSSEFITTSASWTTTTGWTGDNTTGWVHATGNSGTLTYPTAAVIGTKYQISYTVTGFSAGSFTVTFGGQGLAGITATGTFGPTATTTGNLIITPLSTFVGTIVISIKSITAVSSPVISLKDSTNTVRFETRVSSTVNNTFLGLSSGSYNTTGYNNSSVGYLALNANTTGFYNSAIGVQALYSNTTGLYNTTIGTASLANNTSGSYNTSVGVNALQNNTTGAQNSAVGQASLSANTTGNYNAVFGWASLYSNTTGSGNSAIGFQAGRFIADGLTALTVVNNSTYVGYATRASADNVTNETVIGYAAVGSGSNTITLGGSTVANTVIPYGNVGIGLTNPSAKLSITGNITQNATLSAWNAPISVFQQNVASFWNNGPTTVIGHNALYGTGYAATRIGTGNSSTIGFNMDGAGSMDFTNYGTGAAGAALSSSVAMRIDSSGDVGIGTTNPLSKLTVYGTTGITAATTGEATGVGTIRIESGSTSLASDGGLEFKIAGDSNGYGAKIQALNSSGVHLSFATRNATATWSDRMHINPSGNVGIGTSSPNVKLEVIGEQWIGGAVSSGAVLILSADATSGANGVTLSSSFYTGGYGPFIFKTNNTERMRIDSSGNVGIGTSSPTAVLQIASDATGTDFRSLSTKAGIALNFSGSGISYYDSDTTVFRASTSGGSTERMRIDASGNVTLQENISVGGAAPTTSGTGITFPATQAASSNANTLDDYEEGTWTPVLSFATNGTMTYTASTASGVYTKIGNVVTCRVQLVLSAFTAGTASGIARISLPFTPALSYFSASTYATNFTTTYPTLLLSGAAVSYVSVYGNTAINTTPAGIAPANFQATSQVLFSITYTV